MSTHKHFDKICVAVLILTLAVTILFMNGESLGITVVPDQDRESYTGSEFFTQNDLDADWGDSISTRITLNGSTAKVSGPGAYADSGSVTIVQSGYYVVSGALDDGSLIVDAKKYSKVWILLDGVVITSSDGACIDVEQADKVFLTLAEGSQNTLNGASSFSTDTMENGIDAVLFSRDDLTINGEGSLEILAPYCYGIGVNDDLVFTGGMIRVNAAQDAVHVNNSFRMTQASLILQAQDEGIDVDGIGGSFYLADGSLSINSSGDGIHTEGAITLDGGNITIEAEDDGIDTNDALEVNGGEISVTAAMDAVHVSSSFRMTQAEVTLQAQDEGIDADGTDGSIYLTGGSLSICSTGDGIHAEGNVIIDGGSVMIETEDDGIHSGVSCTVSGGTVNIPACYEGIEAPRVEIAGGEITIFPSDDGINACSADSFYDHTAQKTGPSDGALDSLILISGGSLMIINEDGLDADGLDSNGSIYITGGTVFISLADTGSNCAVDFASENGGIAEISGGTLIACGSYDMAESFDTSSTQCVVLFRIIMGAPEGTLFTLGDTDGKTLLSQEIPCSFSSVLFSCDAMTVGSTYRVVIGESETVITLSETTEVSGDAHSGMFSEPEHTGGMNLPAPDTGKPDGMEQPAQQPPNNEDAPQMPGVFQSGEKPQMPDMVRDDAAQNEALGSMQPGRPDSTNGERPDMPADVSESDTQVTETVTQQTPKPETEQDERNVPVPLTPGAWFLIAVSILVLIFGILIAFKARSISI